VAETPGGRRNIVIRVQPATVHISPFGFHRYAKEYFRAALAYEPADGFSPVRYYLVCHAIEVCLKAFLLGKGVPKTKLKNPNLLGHDLVKVLARSRACGLDTYRPLTADEEAELVRANAYYSKKGFEYFEVTKAATGYPDLPKLAVLEALCASLIERLETVGSP
jgi:hypothetical protein